MIVEENFNLINYNSYKINSEGSKVYFPETDEDLVTIFSEIGNAEKFIIGGGYNIILSKTFYEEPFVIFSENFSRIIVKDNILEVQAGITMLELSELAYERGLGGLEIFYDIPGSLGGAIVMNAGSGKEEIKDLVVQVKYFDPKTLTFHTKINSEINFSYRDSFFQQNGHLIVVSAILKLRHKEQKQIREKMELTKLTRHSKQPKNYPNAGSVFKRPKGQFVGPMIEQLGLKGFAIGGAQVSEKHAGFIVNRGGATGQDILDLIKHIKLKVLDAYNVELEVEQRIL